MNEEAFREIMTEILESKVELLQAFEDLGKKFDNLINGKSYFLKEGEKGPSIEVKKVPEKESTTKVKDEITKKKPLIPKKNVLNAKIIHETEKAYIMKREDGLVAVVAKSHLTKEYAKNDVRQNIEFKADRAWALNKLTWEEERIFE